MVESASDRTGDGRADFDVSTIKEAKSVSTVGVVIGAIIPGMLFLFLLILGALAPAQPDAAPQADAAADAMAPADPAADAEAVADAAQAAAEVAPAPLGPYVVRFEGREPIYVHFSENGTYTDGGPGGTWSYDDSGVWCWSDNGSDIWVCFTKSSGTDERSTWVKTDQMSVQFTLEKDYGDAM